MKLYLLDANVLITAAAQYYQIDRVPGFWSWLLHHASEGRVKIPKAIMSEVLRGGGKEKEEEDKEDRLLEWIKKPEHREALLLEEELSLMLVKRVYKAGYGLDLEDDELGQWGNDPFLIAYALAGDNRAVVTAEKSKPTATRHNRKIPDVCDSLNVIWLDPFQFNEELNLRIKGAPEIG